MCPTVYAMGFDISEAELISPREFLNRGVIHFDQPKEFLWAVVEDLGSANQWMLKNLDTPDGWKYPAYLKNITYFPEFEVVELYYGLKLMGFIDSGEMAAAFNVEKRVTSQKMQLTLTLSHPYPVVENAVYHIELEDNQEGGTMVTFEITTKLPPLVYFFFPKKIYNDNIQYILGNLVVNFQERSQMPLNP